MYLAHEVAAPTLYSLRVATSYPRDLDSVPAGAMECAWGQDQQVKVPGDRKAGGFPHGTYLSHSLSIYRYTYIQYAVVCDLRPVRHLFPAVSDAIHGISLQNSCNRQVRQVRNRCLGAQAQSFDLSRSRNWNPGVYRPGLMAMI